MAAPKTQKKTKDRRHINEVQKTEFYQYHAEAVAKRIRFLRCSRTGWTQEQLGEACGLSRNAIQMIEAAQTNMTFTSLVLISDALSVPLPELFNYDEQTRAAEPRVGDEASAQER